MGRIGRDYTHRVQLYKGDLKVLEDFQQEREKKRHLKKSTFHYVE